jgi:catechol 2,3-dioxygenase-like lactoylglutathione lyase family enzyme
MKARITVITLGVDDLDKSLQFYLDLGLESEGIFARSSSMGLLRFSNFKPG